MEHEIAFRSSVMMFASGSDWSYWLSMERLNQVVKPLYDFATLDIVLGLWDNEPLMSTKSIVI